MMIKLKPLIESQSNPKILWQSSKDFPDELISVLHQLWAETLRASGDPTNWIHVIHHDEWWSIENPQKPNRAIAYNLIDRKWYAQVLGNNRNFDANSKTMKYIIARWTK
jgi:hypothetical protein